MSPHHRDGLNSAAACHSLATCRSKIWPSESVAHMHTSNEAEAAWLSQKQSLRANPIFCPLVFKHLQAAALSAKIRCSCRAGSDCSKLASSLAGPCRFVIRLLEQRPMLSGLHGAASRQATGFRSCHQRGLGIKFSSVRKVIVYVFLRTKAATRTERWAP